MKNTIDNNPNDICFGWNRQTDELSLKAFLKKFSQNDFLATLVPRLSDEELIGIVDQLSNLMGKHLSEKEYHHLFLTRE